jgi:hypothetical protein
MALAGQLQNKGWASRPAVSLAVFRADSLVQSGYMDIATHAAQHAGDVALQGSF